MVSIQSIFQKGADSALGSASKSSFPLLFPCFFQNQCVKLERHSSHLRSDTKPLCAVCRGARVTSPCPKVFKNLFLDSPDTDQGSLSHRVFCFFHFTTRTLLHARKADHLTSERTAISTQNSEPREMRRKPLC